MIKIWQLAKHSPFGPRVSIILYGNYYHRVFIADLVESGSHASLSKDRRIQFALITRDYTKSVRVVLSSILKSWLFPNVYLWVPGSSAYIYQLAMILAFHKVYIYSDGLSDIIDKPSLSSRLVSSVSGRNPYTISSVSQYVQLLQRHDQVSPELSGDQPINPYLLLNLKYPRYLGGTTASILLRSIVEYTSKLSASLDVKILVSTHRLFDVNLSAQSIEVLRSCDAVFDSRPIFELISSSSYRALVSLPSGVIADALALAPPMPISLIDPRSKIHDSFALTRISAYIDMLHAFAPNTISVISL